MKYFVNDNCIGCGLCNGICPEVFIMAGTGMAEAADQQVPAELEAAALEAMEGCPVQAIEQQ